MSEAELDAIGHGRFEEALSTDTLEAVRFARTMTRDPHGMAPDLVERLRARYGDAGVVELASVVGLCNYFNRFTSVFRVDLSGDGRPYDETRVRLTTGDGSRCSLP